MSADGNQLFERLVGEVGAFLDQRFYVIASEAIAFMLDERRARRRSHQPKSDEQKHAEALSQRPARTPGDRVQSTVRLIWALRNGHGDEAVVALRQGR